MDLLYVYDDKIACDRDGNYYTGSAFSQEIFDRISLSLTRSHSLCAERLSAPTICRRSPG